MQPLVGISGRRATDSSRVVDGTETAYVQAVLAAGGIPVVVPVMSATRVAGVLDRLDGLVFTGGKDIQAQWYGHESAKEAQPAEHERDSWELALVHGALRRDVPILAICRGEQLLNVVAGGTLIQHLPSVSDLAHRRSDRQYEHAHSVRLEPDSLLASIVGSETLGVNTLHHQAVEKIGTGLRAVAWSEDGVIEAIEATGGVRALGVQWHPELLAAQARHAKLFSWVVDESSKERSAKLQAAAEPLLAAAPHNV